MYSHQYLLPLLSESTSEQIYLTDLSGCLINQHVTQKMRQFILDSLNINEPLKRINTFKTYFGPALINHTEQKLFAYLSIPNQKSH
jgi:two-component system sensor histidine kinase CpxA